MIPFWLHVLVDPCAAGGRGLRAYLARRRHGAIPQHMWIMNVVWPVTGALCRRRWRCGAISASAAATVTGAAAVTQRKSKPFFGAVGIGATHCGAGCTLGDIVAEWLCFVVPAVAVWFGWQSIFADKMFAVWVLDFIFAFVFGIVFQYFTIAPMRGLVVRPGIVAALKADTLSLTAWQIGMYGFMALAQYVYFRPLLGKLLEVNTPEFWFTMQIAMLAGFVTSYPVNWWLIKAGIKEKM